MAKQGDGWLSREMGAKFIEKSAQYFFHEKLIWILCFISLENNSFYTENSIV